MQRRTFCHSMLGSAAGLAIGAHGAEPIAGTAAALAATPDACATAFAAQRAVHPWTAGYAGLQANVAALPMRLRGRLPLASSFTPPATTLPAMPAASPPKCPSLRRRLLGMGFPVRLSVMPRGLRCG